MAFDPPPPNWEPAERLWTHLWMLMLFTVNTLAGVMTGARTWEERNITNISLCWSLELGNSLDWYWHGMAWYYMLMGFAISKSPFCPDLDSLCKMLGGAIMKDHLSRKTSKCCLRRIVRTMITCRNSICSNWWCTEKVLKIAWLTKLVKG